MHSDRPGDSWAMAASLAKFPPNLVQILPAVCGTPRASSYQPPTPHPARHLPRDGSTWSCRLKSGSRWERIQTDSVLRNNQRRIVQYSLRTTHLVIHQIWGQKMVFSRIFPTEITLPMVRQDLNEKQLVGFECIDYPLRCSYPLRAFKVYINFFCFKYSKYQ
jgi:hypothetical protein